ncbi:uncharacterized protein At4g00950-like [Gastrolobium bilobum]|uniref:uncharacterized protein At4g00950-like n=1 Tax=Gastrolobium bilobum TaxID=150636 RepID=UPI002AB0BE10|nr:uncharacterized protein At4g00950-like [Gastrolobium bilobum]
MGSLKKKLHHHHDHDDRGHESLCYDTPPKLSILPSRPTMQPEAPTPPPRTRVSVPFKWEEAPGKPRPCHTRSEPMDSDSTVARTLELPPRLLFSETNVSNNMPSPTTVLDGPYVGRAMSFTSSYRTTPKDTWNSNFGSSRWGGLKKSNRVGREGSFDFSNWTEDGASKVKITRVRRRGSFLSLSDGSSHLWASIYESLKQVVPWSRRQERQRKWAPKIDTV